MSYFVRNPWLNTAEEVAARLTGAASRLAEGRTNWLRGYIDAVHGGAAALTASDRRAGQAANGSAGGLLELYNRPCRDRGELCDPAFAEAGLSPNATRTKRGADQFNWFDMSPGERVNHDIDVGLYQLNPGWKSGDPRWRSNCASVVTAFELRQRGYRVEAGPLADHLLKDDGNYALHHELVWGARLTEHGRDGLPFAFREPGSRGIVFIEYPDGAGHFINVVHVPDQGLRFVDGQPDPPRTDASGQLAEGTVLAFMRVDDLEPAPSAVADLGVRFLDPNQSLPEPGTR
ncbi:hypothetical protein [Nocardia brasiliensis]|uniref:hypothetical protein n=1 Tax=Nocardia brasiliensis TaxID=37326 RepID=UPI0024570B99|nr:hypothetical protein [Nocardia brasiliensis]